MISQITKNTCEIAITFRDRRAVYRRHVKRIASDLQALDAVASPAPLLEVATAVGNALIADLREGERDLSIDVALQLLWLGARACNGGAHLLETAREGGSEFSCDILEGNEGVTLKFCAAVMGDSDSRVRTGVRFAADYSQLSVDRGAGDDSLV